MRTPLNAPLIPASRELVRLTREAWGLTKDAFGPRVGYTGEYVGQVEHGLKMFSDKAIAAGCTHADPQVRAFWQAYRTARRHELDVAIIENCMDAAASV
jgi:hypothetical protein